MQTHCNANQLSFQGFHGRDVCASFDGGHITSDAGGLLLRESSRVNNSFRGSPSASRTCETHGSSNTLSTELLSQRVYGLCFGNEDLNDHDQLRADPLLALLCGKKDLEGSSPKERARSRQGLGGQEHAEQPGDRREPVRQAAALQEDRRRDATSWKSSSRRRFCERPRRAPRLLILDFDATDDPLHGKQEGRFFHGYYDCYCYLPLYVFCGDQLLWAQLRKADIDASDGALEVLQRLVKMIRHKWPLVQILIRADSGFCRDDVDELVRGQRGELSLRNGQKQASFEAHQPHDEKGKTRLGSLGPRRPTLCSVLAIAPEAVGRVLAASWARRSTWTRERTRVSW